MTGYQIDWQEVRDEAVEILRNFIRINTVNPPGNELEAARFLEGILRKEGIEATVYESAPRRGNLLAVIPGKKKAGSLILLSHMDVVPAETDKWDLDPFGGIIKDGYIYGRGALDNKGNGVVDLMAMLLLKRLRIPLKRDVILLAAADEEVGGRQGVKWMLEQEPRLKEAGCVLNEGGAILVRDNGELDHYEIATAQKVVAQFAVRAKGRTGHGSMPHGDSATVKLIRALDRLVAWETPFMVIPLVKEYFANLAKVRPPQESKGYRDIEEGLRDPSFAKTFVADPQYNAMVRNTITPTILKAGQMVNVIPSEAQASFDCRLLPGTSSEAFLAEVREIIKDEGVEVVPLPEFESNPLPPSPMDNELYQAIGQPLLPADRGALLRLFTLSSEAGRRQARPRP